MTFTGAIAAIWRHPIKGFTPERLSSAALSVGRGLAHDRAWAVENGPSGFDPAAPAHISKVRFVALAPVPEAAAVRTTLDEATGRITASSPGRAPVTVDLTLDPDAQRFADWLADVLGEAVEGPLKVVQAPGHRFLDDPDGQISITNRASLAALEAQVGAPVDPRRLRGNLEIDGWPAFAEVGLSPGTRSGSVPSSPGWSSPSGAASPPT